MCSTLEWGLLASTVGVTVNGRMVKHCIIIKDFSFFVFTGEAVLYKNTEDISVQSSKCNSLSNYFFGLNIKNPALCVSLIFLNSIKYA